jgi:hypothetical protein
MSRPLTEAEENLIRWMLEHGTLEAKHFLPQLENVRVMDWRCPCGCASINFTVEGLSEPTGDFQILADFVFGAGENLSGIFIFQQNDVLAGLEVYGLAGDAPKFLPSLESLRSYSDVANPI